MQTSVCGGTHRDKVGPGKVSDHSCRGADSNVSYEWQKPSEEKMKRRGIKRDIMDMAKGVKGGNYITDKSIIMFFNIKAPRIGGSNFFIPTETDFIKQLFLTYMVQVLTIGLCKLLLTVMCKQNVSFVS